MQNTTIDQSLTAILQIVYHEKGMNVVMDTFHNFLETCSFNGSQASFLESIPSPASQDESMATSEDSSLHSFLDSGISGNIIDINCLFDDDSVEVTQEARVMADGGDQNRPAKRKRGSNAARNLQCITEDPARARQEIAGFKKESEGKAYD